MPTLNELRLLVPRTPANIAFEKVLACIRSARTAAHIKACDNLLLNFNAMHWRSERKHEMAQSCNFLANELQQRRVQLVALPFKYAAQ